MRKTVWTDVPGSATSELCRVFGENLRLSRMELGMTQATLSEMCGVGARSISVIENGANVTLTVVERLARHVNRTPADTDRISAVPPTHDLLAIRRLAAQALLMKGSLG